MQHTYTSHIEWTGNKGVGTRDYRAYDRCWNVAIPGKPVIACSNDPLLGGDPARLNPEDMLLSALAACHMLWYLHFAADAGIVVTSYRDSPIATGEVERGGAGRFLSATLRPEVEIAAEGDIARAEALHARIHAVCFIARSVNFPVSYSPVTRIATQGPD